MFRNTYKYALLLGVGCNAML